MTKPSDSDLFQHILDACNAISTRMAGVAHDDFEKNDVLMDSVIRQIEIVGEAVRLLSEDSRRAHPEVPWAQIQSMRNRLIHGYWSVDSTAVYNTAVRDIPQLAAALRRFGVPLIDTGAIGNV
jgi:uncharacterized protein with HEPN domain